MVSLTTLLSAAALALTVLADKYLYLADCGPSQTFVLAMYSKGSEPGKQQKPDSVKIVGNDNPSFSFEAAELTATFQDSTKVSVELNEGAKSLPLDAVAGYGSSVSDGSEAVFPCYKDNDRLLYYIDNYTPCYSRYWCEP